jgi:hypothetical protein
MRTPPTQSQSSTGIARPSEPTTRPASPGSFRESLKRRDEPKKRSSASKTRLPLDAGLQARSDGMLVISAPMGPPPSHPDARRAPAAPRATGPALAGTRNSGPRSVAITDVKIGGTKDSASVHARIGEGRHAGIELRAHEQNGKISIELLARDADAARALRSELADLRESLRSRGLESVNVEVRADVRDQGSHHDESQNTPDAEPDGAAREDSASVQPAAQESDTIVL